MNKVILMGRLTRDPDIRYSTGDSPLCVGKYTLAVDRRFKRDGQPTTDFINCVLFGKQAEFAEKYLTKGTKLVVSGRIQTGSYKNKDGATIYTTDVVVEEQDFAESKKDTRQEEKEPEPPKESSGGFMEIPEGIEKELPFL